MLASSMEPHALNMQHANSDRAEGIPMPATPSPTARGRRLRHELRRLREQAGLTHSEIRPPPRMVTFQGQPHRDWSVARPDRRRPRPARRSTASPTRPPARHSSSSPAKPVAAAGGPATATYSVAAPTSVWRPRPPDYGRTSRCSSQAYSRPRTTPQQSSEQDRPRTIPTPSTGDWPHGWPPRDPQATRPARNLGRTRRIGHQPVPVGGRDVMRAQLEHLIELSTTPNATLTLQVTAVHRRRAPRA